MKANVITIGFPAGDPLMQSASSTLMSIGPEVRIGHVNLKMANLDHALRSYRDALGFEITQCDGRAAAFLSARGYHHHIGLNTWESEGGVPPPAECTGLYHLAILYRTRAELMRAAGLSMQGFGWRVLQIMGKCSTEHPLS